MINDARALMIKLMKNTFFAASNVESQLSEMILNTNHLSMGSYTQKFEADFSKWHKRKHCIMVNSGSSANLVLIGALLNLGHLRKGDRVAVSAVTWSTNVMPLMQLGLEPVLIDVAPNGVNMSLENLCSKIKDINAVFLTNVLGLKNEVRAIANLCKTHSVQFFEDNCESLGCYDGDELFGNFGTASTCSSFVGHHLSTIEGGYIFTDDDVLAAMLKVVRAHGWTRNLSEEELNLLNCDRVDDFNQAYTFHSCGFNARPTDISAFCGLLQIEKINYYNKIREERFCQMADKLGKFIYAPETKNPVFAIALRMESQQQRDAVVKFLNENKIDNRPVVSGSMGTQPFWVKKYGRAEQENAMLVDKLGFYVSNDPQLTDAEFTYLKEKLEQVLL